MHIHYIHWKGKLEFIDCFGCAAFLSGVIINIKVLLNMYSRHIICTWPAWYVPTTEQKGGPASLSALFYGSAWLHLKLIPLLY